MRGPRALLEFLPVWAASWLLRAIPRGAALAAGRAAGRAAFAVDRRHRRVALQNLKDCFGDSMPESERLRLAGRVFAHFGAMAVDCLLMRWMTPRDLDRLVEHKGVENIRGAFRKGRGVLVFSGHFGNWEMVALMQGWLGYPMVLVTRTMDNPHLERLLRKGRAASGNDVIPKRDAVRGVLKALRNGWCAAIVIDQDTRGSDHVFVDFMGRPTAATPALALLAMRTGAPVVPAFGVPLSGGRYRVTYMPEVPVQELARSRDRDEAVAAITQACTAVLESQVRARPDLWLWMHRRWKRRPRPREAGALGAVAQEEAP